jgi:CubicO group peptidase (beta-lactamase class C family)
MTPPNQGSNPSDPTDEEALRLLVVETARRYRSRILWRDALNIGTDALVVVLLAGMAIFTPGARLMFGAPLIVTAMGYAFVGAFRFASRLRQKKREEKFDDSIHGLLRKLVANANYQIRLHGKFTWWYFPPIIPGFVLVIASFATWNPAMSWIFGILTCFIFGSIDRAHRRQLRTELIPRKAELESLLATVEANEGRTVEIPPATCGTNTGMNKGKVRLVFAVGLALGAVGCLVIMGGFILTMHLPQGDPRPPDFDDISAFGPSDIAQINAWLLEQVALSEYPSLSVAIVRDGTTVYREAFGFENIRARRRATAATAYHVASVTKAFTASLAALLHHRGVIDLDQPVAKYLPAGVSISTRPDLGAKITLRQLASHTSGLPRGIPGVVQSIEGRYALEPERLYQLLATARLEFEPGTRDLYSNLGFGLLGHALELAAGQPLNTLLQELLCEPLHLERTALYVDAKIPVATGYSTPLRLPESHPLRRRLAGSGGLVSSAEDLARFLAAHMQPGLFNNDMLEQLHSETRLADGSEIRRALGWVIDTGTPTGRILSKNGGRSNCSAWIGFAPEHGVGVAVIANAGEPDVDPIGRWLLERAVPGGSRPSTRHGYAKVAPYTGVRWANDRPIVRVQGRWSSLVSIDGLPIDRIMKHARNTFGTRARKRLAEDLPQLLSSMDHDPDWEVTLGLENTGGQVEYLKVRMTERNRALVRE